MRAARRLLLLDNFDSFTYNLAQALAALGVEVAVARSEQLEVSAVLSPELSGLVLSPGPGRPEDAGICPAALRALDEVGSPLPVLGVCLGHQVIAQVYGAQVVRAARPIHGEIWEVVPVRAAMEKNPRGKRAVGGGSDRLCRADGGGQSPPLDDPLWRQVPAPLQATRYHSLVVAPGSVPPCLEVTARTPSGEIMALRHRTRPRWGVQFHPESVGTPAGVTLLGNFVKLCQSR